MEQLKSTTVTVIRHNSKTVMVADGQVTFGHTVLKENATKVRKLGTEKHVLVGFAGSAADGLTLLEKFEAQLNKYSYDLARASVELAKEWRLDRVLRRLDALLLVANNERIFLLSGTGEVLEPAENVACIGSGGEYARSAGLALLEHAPHLDTKDIALESMKIASKICIYTNDNFTIEEI
jgi:ATP-dependent HslUV protease, peptidase subunit HslV